MIDWIVKQFVNFNVLTVIVMVTFVTTMSKSNLQKHLKKQSDENYKEFEEIKDEIREHNASMMALITSTKK